MTIDVIAFFLFGGIVYAYLISRVVSHAWFAAKLSYHINICKYECGSQKED